MTLSALGFPEWPLVEPGLQRDYVERGFDDAQIIFQAPSERNKNLLADSAISWPILLLGVTGLRRQGFMRMVARPVSPGAQAVGFLEIPREVTFVAQADPGYDLLIRQEGGL